MDEEKVVVDPVVEEKQELEGQEQVVVEPSTPDVPPEKKDDTVPLKTFLELKKENKELKRLQAEREDAKLDEVILNKKNELRQKWVDRGYTEEIAEAMSEDLSEIYSNISSIGKTKAEVLIESEIEELATESDFSDALNYKESIVATLKKGKKAGLDMSVEDAYFMVAGRTKYRELKNKATVIGRAGSQNNSSGDNLPTSGSSKNENMYNLDADDLKALKGLQQMQPGSGWTAKKYFETMKKTE